ncbi:MAG: M1 family metallopeptidase, partial [Ilumatobacteraceae bacterium]
MSDNPYRLPRNALPSRYRLVLEPDLDNATFSGSVSIDIDVIDDVESVVLNSDELNIDSVRISGVEAAFHLDPSTQRLIIDAAVAAGEVVVDIAFTGVLNDKLRGWYRSTFN